MQGFLIILLICYHLMRRMQAITWNIFLFEVNPFIFWETPLFLFPITLCPWLIYHNCVHKKNSPNCCFVHSHFYFKNLRCEYLAVFWYICQSKGNISVLWLVKKCFGIQLKQTNEFHLNPWLPNLFSLLNVLDVKNIWTTYYVFENNSSNYF